MELSDIVGLNKAERKLKDSLAFKLGIDLNIGDLTTLNQAKDEFKNYVISNALARNNYNVTAAAKELGIDRKTIQRRKDSQDQSLKLYAGEEAIKNAIYKVLNHYLPDTPKDNKLLDLKAKELSTYIQQNKKTLDEATKIFETYLVDLTVFC